MTRIEDALAPPNLSVLDRLLVDDASEPRTYREAVAALRRSVLRDLEWLLNARIGTDPNTPDPFNGRTEPGGEILRFGLPDITLLDLRNERKRQQLQAWLAEVVQRFEPGLEDVRVSVRGSDERRGSTRFHIEGRLRVEPEPIQFPFEVDVKWADRAVEIQGTRP